MKGEAVFEYWINKGEILPVETFSDIYNYEVPAVYEVIRLIEGVPLFLEEHLDRMYHSLKMLGRDNRFSEQYFREMIQKLVLVNRKTDFNIKIVVFVKEELEAGVFFIETFYPDKKMYQEGVSTGLISMVRENPNAKVMNYSFKQMVKDEMDKKKLYELLLINEHNEITEGSRSNVFFVSGHDVITPPAGQVLKGVTRRHIFSVCAERKIKILEEAVRRYDLPAMDAVFLTGTSPKVLPVKNVDNCIFASSTNYVVLQIMQGYEQNLEKYISAHPGLKCMNTEGKA